MSRHARVVLPGLPHHITQRGNNRQDVFFADGDRLAYLGVLREQCANHDVRILGYCLMTNHVHLIIIPAREDALNLAVGRTHLLHTQMINRLHGRSGHLWQGRFHSCPMDDAHTIAAMRYVERNPLRAALTQTPWAYQWSSAAAHVGHRGLDQAERSVDGAVPNCPTADLLDLATWHRLAGGIDWKGQLMESEDQNELAALRLNTQTGRPLVGDSFPGKSETELGRPLPADRSTKARAER